MQCILSFQRFHDQLARYVHIHRLWIYACLQLCVCCKNFSWGKKCTQCGQTSPNQIHSKTSGKAESSQGIYTSKYTYMLYILTCRLALRLASHAYGSMAESIGRLMYRIYRYIYIAAIPDNVLTKHLWGIWFWKEFTIDFSAQDFFQNPKWYV